MDKDLEKPLTLAKGRLSWSWKFQMMRMGVGVESSILGEGYGVQPNQFCKVFVIFEDGD